MGRVDVGVARGWNIWELENGGWAWNAWDHLQSLSGIEETETRAQRAAHRALEWIVAEGRAAAQAERELPETDDRRDYWDPQSRTTSRAAERNQVVTGVATALGGASV